MYEDKELVCKDCCFRFHDSITLGNTPIYEKFTVSILASEYYHGRYSFYLQTVLKNQRRVKSIDSLKMIELNEDN